jgi:hypothetical protein
MTVVTDPEVGSLAFADGAELNSLRSVAGSESVAGRPLRRLRPIR